MTDVFESVVGLLQEETEAHRRLLDLAREEQRALVRGDVQSLQRLVAEQEQVVGQVRGLERARLQLLELVAERLGRSVQELSLRELVAASPPDVGRRLEAQRHELTGVLRELADVNKANALLVRAHMEYVRHLVGILTRSADGPASLVVDRWT
ncbi:MAG: flagellar protein FlgN [Armatimonadota bacterium]|nr:flagellar protein FlgN [Armatimonadota bacterium]MDR5690312.1 flagellar protein FlgN [Armatimonadota bacterium]MDR7396627.1 flagellar protein FlgN [Armatimonadota bacterium]MDR7399048.1 flagellar protein FlgN [Armatimonadota bacterium]MDR7405784.1 flagellar protein FlgN [Armatimonadota bacterium]